MFKNYSKPISKGEEKHKTEVELCEMADSVVGIGPKLSEAFRSYLRSSNKDDNVLDVTPGVFEVFETVNQVPNERQQRNVLVFGRGDEDFELLIGFDIAGRAIATLQDTLLVFVGAPEFKALVSGSRSCSHANPIWPMIGGRGGGGLMKSREIYTGVTVICVYP